MLSIPQPVFLSNGKHPWMTQQVKGFMSFNQSKVCDWFNLIRDMDVGPDKTSVYLVRVHLNPTEEFNSVFR